MDVNTNKPPTFFAVLSVFLFFLLCLSYSNHFSNPFEFDDFHTIVNNEYIQDIKNLPLFFTDIKYFGTNPGNQGYRPILVSLNAIDHWLAGGLKVEVFHAHIFLSFLCMLVLVFLFFRLTFSLIVPDTKNNLTALLATAFYGLHASNAETINYICQRADMGSTLWILAALLLFMHPKGRRYFLYVPAIALALGTKETGAMTGVILFFYVLMMEEQVSLIELVTFKKFRSTLSGIKKTLPALILSMGLFFVAQKVLYTDAPVVAGPDAPKALNFYATQCVVFAHYIGNFILPLDLSADPDFTIYENVLDRRVLLSVVLLVALVFIAFFTSAKKETRPISFGILWFFLALLPTAIIPHSGQIANDHRTFFPYIGLVMSVVWWARLLYNKYEGMIRGNALVSRGLLISYLLVISLHSYGTYQRNEVWSSSKTLWKDAAEKSPKNGRALMNYGLTLMAEGKYDETLPYFQRTLELLPYWAYIHINMGVLREAMGFSQEAEQHYQKAIRFQPNVPDAYYFYAQWLNKKGRGQEALTQIGEGLRISPGHAGLSQLSAQLSATAAEPDADAIGQLEKLVTENPTHDNYINLSLAYYRSGKYAECVSACEKALELDPRSSLAYNNMCSAYNSMEEWEKGAVACRKALEIDPNFERAKNNLKWAEGNIK